MNTLSTSSINTSLKHMLLTLLLMMAQGFNLQAQDSQSDASFVKELTEEFGRFNNRFLDWAALSYATYTGAHDAELGSVFGKVKKNLDDKPHIKAIIGDLQASSKENALKDTIKYFTNKTGIGIYFAAKLVDENDLYIPIFNNFLAEGAAKPIAPYLIVSPIVSGNKKDGYQVSYTIETSPDLNAKKYKLDKVGPKNPFHVLSGSFSKRKDFVSSLRANLVLATTTLAEKIDDNFHANLLITYHGDIYRPGEEIEEAMDADPDAAIRLKVVNRDGTTPTRSIAWRVSPDGAEYTTSGNELVFLPTTAGRFIVVAESGRDKAPIEIKIVDFNLDWKQFVKPILYELLVTRLDVAQAKSDSLAALSAALNADLQSRLQEAEVANYPLHSDGSQFYSVYDEPKLLTGKDTVIFYRNAKRSRSFAALRKVKRNSIATLREVNLAAFIDILIEDPSKLSDLIKNLGANSGPLIIELFTSSLSPEEKKAKIKQQVINYLNANLEQLADAEFADRHYRHKLAAEALPAPVSSIPAAQDPNFYISPEVYFEGIAAFKEELKATLDTMANPPFVVINYSQDLSTEGYIERSAAGKPKGIGDRPYLVYTLVNSPGSTYEYFELGHEPSDAYKDTKPAKIVKTDLNEVGTDIIGKNLEGHLIEILNLYWCAKDRGDKHFEYFGYQQSSHHLLGKDDLFNLVRGIEIEGSLGRYDYSVAYKSQSTTVDESSSNPEFSSSDSYQIYHIDFPRINTPQSYIRLKFNNTADRDQFQRAVLETSHSDKDYYYSSLNDKIPELIRKEDFEALRNIYTLVPPACLVFEELSIQDRITFINHIIDDVKVNTDEEALVLKLLHGGSEPAKFAAALTSLNWQELFNSISDERSATLDGILIELAMAYKNGETAPKIIGHVNYTKLSTYNFSMNYKIQQSNGSVKLKIDYTSYDQGDYAIYGDGTQIIEPCHPFDLATFSKNVDDEDALDLTKQPLYPAILIMKKVANDEQLRHVEQLELTMDVASLFFGIGEINLALKSPTVLSRIARLSLGAVDLLATATDIYCTGPNDDSDLCKRWQEYGAYVQMGLISASALDQFKTLYKSSPEARKVLEDVNFKYADKARIVDNTGEISNALRKSFDDLKLTPAQRTKFLEDFGDKPELLARFEGNPRLVDGWKKFDDLGVDEALRKNLGALDAYNKRLNNEIVPEPNTYLSQSYIDNHLAKFDDGAVRFTTDAYPTLGRDDAFVMPKSEFDNLMIETGGDLIAIEIKLTLKPGILTGDNAVIAWVKKEDFDGGIKFPTGNESGAWPGEWIPGGKTAGGVSEAILDLSDPNLPKTLFPF